MSLTTTKPTDLDEHAALQHLLHDLHSNQFLDVDCSITDSLCSVDLPFMLLHAEHALSHLDLVRAALCEVIDRIKPRLTSEYKTQWRVIDTASREPLSDWLDSESDAHASAVESEQYEGEPVCAVECRTVPR